MAAACYMRCSLGVAAASRGGLIAPWRGRWRLLPAEDQQAGLLLTEVVAADLAGRLSIKANKGSRLFSWYHQGRRILREVWLPVWRGTCQGGARHLQRGAEEE